MDFKKILEDMLNGEIHYLKKILLNSKNEWFNHGMFIDFSNSDMSKQASLKLLNSLLGKKFLISRVNRRKEELFKINSEIIKYEL